ncbi:MAG TPA: hypothetical protein VFC46_15480 [Humisphaera sp.]|nr:hypothetical protein [Humisphaera sp.]
MEILFDDDPLVLRQLNPAVVSMMVVDHENHDLARLVDGDDDGDSEWIVAGGNNRAAAEHV